jgi:demethylmenaquinone methyltransferase/2-methoxy-6-polyprenyl-1,4-benzoquinol methylase
MLKKENIDVRKAQNRYKWVYNEVISKFYDRSLKIGLSIFGEDKLRKQVVDFISPYINHKDHLLDLCCGTGTLTILLADSIYSDCNIMGVDLSAGQISQAIKKTHLSNLHFKTMDASKLEFEANSVNIVIISAALHEMETSLRIRVLSEIYRVLVKGGYLFIFDHHEPSEVKLRIFYNIYLGFWEKILSKSFEMQRNIFRELKLVSFKPQKQIIFDKRFYKFFQIIISEK